MGKLTVPCAARLSNNVPSDSGDVHVSIGVDASFSPNGSLLSVTAIEDGGVATHQFRIENIDELMQSHDHQVNKAQDAHDLLTAVNLQSSRAIWMDMPSTSLPPVHERDPMPSPPTEIRRERNEVHVKAHVAVGVSVSARVALRTTQLLDHDEAVAWFRRIQHRRSSSARNPIRDRGIENFMRGCNSIDWNSQITAWWAAIEQAADVLGEATSGSGLVSAVARRAGLSVDDVDGIRIINNRIKHGSTGDQDQERLYEVFRGSPGRFGATAHVAAQAMVRAALQ